MLEDHDKFIEAVISKVAKQKTYNTTKKERKEMEEATIISLMEVTGLKRLEVKKIMEKTRQDQKKNERKGGLNNLYGKLFLILVLVIAVSVIIAVV